MNGSRHRYVVDFAVDGDIRFLSHNDMVRMFSRACARAGLPVRYSEGFNPRMRLMLPLPRPVGQSSDVERLIVELDEPIAAEELLERLGHQVPAGVTLRKAAALAATESCTPIRVRYRTRLIHLDVEAISLRARSLLDSGSIRITRVRHKDGRSKTVDIRQFIDDIVVDDEGISMSLQTTHAGSTTPAEVCAALGLDTDPINHLTRRVEIQWQNSQAKPPPTQ